MTKKENNNWLEIRKDFLRQFLILITQYKSVERLYERVYDDLVQLETIPKN